MLSETLHRTFNCTSIMLFIFACVCALARAVEEFRPSVTSIKRHSVMDIFYPFNSADIHFINGHFWPFNGIHILYFINHTRNIDIASQIEGYALKLSNSLLSNLSHEIYT